MAFGQLGRLGAKGGFGSLGGGGGLPSNVLLDEGGHPILDESGSYITV